MAAGTGSPCGACKFLRRKCATDCVFAPYFCSETGPASFAAIHKVFGASNASKMLLPLPVAERCEAVVTIAYEAQARVRDPVYGCVAHIFALQQQVACLQAQLMQVKAQMVQNLVDSSNVQNQWPGNTVGVLPIPTYPTYVTSISPQSSLESIDRSNNIDGMRMQELQSCRDDLRSFQPCSKKSRPSQTDLSELHEVARRMTRN